VRGCAVCSRALASERLEAAFRYDRDPLYVCAPLCAEEWEARQHLVALALGGQVGNPVVRWTLVREG